MGSAKAVANPHKDDLDDLTDIEGQAEVRNEVCSKIRDNAQVENLAQTLMSIKGQDRVNILPYLNLQPKLMITQKSLDRSSMSELALPSHTIQTRVQQYASENSQLKVRKGQENDQAEDMVVYP
jgi:hypothetical protein